MEWYIAIIVCIVCALIQFTACKLKKAVYSYVALLLHLATFVLLYFLRASYEQMFVCLLFSVTAFYFFNGLFNKSTRENGDDKTKPEEIEQKKNGERTVAEAEEKRNDANTVTADEEGNAK